jgi:hypothetical protein
MHAIRTLRCELIKMKALSVRAYSIEVLAQNRNLKAIIVKGARRV